MLHSVELFETDNQRRGAMRMLAEAGFASGEDQSMNGLHVGIKKLLSIIEMARQEPDHAAERLVGSLMGLGM